MFRSRFASTRGRGASVGRRGRGGGVTAPCFSKQGLPKTQNPPSQATTSKPRGVSSSSKPRKKEFCAYCKRQGHNRTICHRANKLCFSCGLTNQHVAKDCPNPSNVTTATASRPTPSNVTTATASRPTQPTPSNVTTATASHPTHPTPSNVTTATASHPTHPTPSNVTTATASRPTHPTPTATRPSPATRLMASSAPDTPRLFKMPLGQAKKLAQQIQGHSDSVFAIAGSVDGDDSSRVWVIMGHKEEQLVGTINFMSERQGKGVVYQISEGEEE